MRRLFTPLVALATAVVMLFASGQAMAQTEVTLWSHWAAEKIKRDFVEEAIKQLRGEEPGHQDQGRPGTRRPRSTPRSRRRCAPARRRTSSTPSRTRSSTWRTASCSISPTSTGQNIEPWAKEAWSYKGKPYGFPLEAWTVELYYNKKMMGELGVKVPDSLQLSPDAFLDMVKKAKAKGIDADGARRRRPSLPGRPPRPTRRCSRSSASTTTTSCSAGKLAWTDPRVVDTLKWLRSRDRGRPAADDLHDAQARRGAHLLPHQSRRR